MLSRPPTLQNTIGKFVRLSMPTYDESSLFGLSLSYLLVLSFSTSFHLPDWRFFEGGAYAVCALFFVGMAVSVVNALIPRDKTTLERKIMLWYAALGNGMSAIWAAALALDRGLSAWSIFPALNLVNGYILVAMPRVVGLDEGRVPNEDARPRDLLWMTFAVAVVFLLGERVMENQWPYTLAMCVVYANNFNRPLTNELFRARGTALLKRRDGA